MMSKKYDFSQVPLSWQFCFHAGCPRRDECLRYQSGLEIPEDRETGSAVFPTACKGGTCRFFRKDERVTMATGFVVDGNPQMNSRFVSMRLSLSRYLGGNGTYYLYRNGRKWLTPRQQQDIRMLFRKAGYKEEVVFGKTVEEYDFT